MGGIDLPVTSFGIFIGVLAKMDGDSTAEDWITDLKAQQELCTMIDRLIDYLEILL